MILSEATQRKEEEPFLSLLERSAASVLATTFPIVVKSFLPQIMIFKSV